MAHNHGHNKGHHGTKLNKLLDFLSVGKPLKGKDLYKAAKAEARIQTKPQVDSYKRLAKQLEGEKRFEAKGLERLGKKSSNAVSSVYQGVAQQAAANLAQQAAIGNQLNSQQAQIGKNFGQGLAQGQSTQLGGFLAQQKRQNAPQTSTAQQQLAQVVANQQQQAAADQKAAQAFAGSQAAGSVSLAGNLGTSASLQGASAVAGIQSAINSRVAESDLKYRQDIGEARGKAADARALKGSDIVQALQQLRGQEQQFLLGKKATAATVQGNKLQAKSSAASTAASIANSKRTAHSAAASRHQDAHQFNRTHTASGRPLGSKPPKGSGTNHGHDLQHHQQRAVQHLVAKLKSGNQKKLHNMSRSQLVNALLASSDSTVSRSEVKKAVKRYLGKSGHKGGNKHHKPPNAI